MSAKISVLGQRFGRLLVIEEFPAEPGLGYRRARCRCDCGVESIVAVTSLRAGLTRSCGCAIREATRARSLRHGECTDRKRTPEFRAWVGMKTRCLNVNVKSFPNYGGRGIVVCPRWLHSFENFLADMGRRPSPKHSIDRFDNDGPYAPDNCRWATPHEQRLNQRPIKRPTHCQRGHAFTPENSYARPGHPDWRLCKTCRKARRNRHGIVKTNAVL